MNPQSGSLEVGAKDGMAGTAARKTAGRKAAGRRAAVRKAAGRRRLYGRRNRPGKEIS